MSDCGVCISNGDGETVEMIRENDAVKARKQHQCHECRRPILKGQTHQVHVTKFDGDFEVYRTCQVCVEIRRGFSCDGSWTYGALWDDLTESFEYINDSCFTKIQTVEAKRYLRERWMKWKGLTA